MHTLIKTGNETSRRLYVREWALFAGFVAHGGYETAEVRDAQRVVGWRGLYGGSGKIVDGLFPGRPQSFRHQHRPVDNCSP